MANKKVNKSKYAILGMLSERPMSGYTIMQKIKSHINFFWSESSGQIYPILKKIEQEELATKEVQLQEGKPNKNVYTITDKGIQELQTWLEAPDELQSNRNELLLKLFFAQKMPIEKTLGKLLEHQTKMKNRLKQFEEVNHFLINDQKDHPNLVYWHSTLRMGMLRVEAEITWTEETITRLNNLSLQKLEVL